MLIDRKCEERTESMVSWLFVQFVRLELVVSFSVNHRYQKFTLSISQISKGCWLEHSSVHCDWSVASDGFVQISSSSRFNSDLSTTINAPLRSYKESINEFSSVLRLTLDWSSGSTFVVWLLLEEIRRTRRYFCSFSSIGDMEGALICWALSWIWDVFVVWSADVESFISLFIINFQLKSSFSS